MQKTECGLLIKQISDQISKTSNNELREDNITLSQLRCLEYIHENPKEKIPLKELEAHFHISQPTLAGLISRLCQKGLVVTETSEINSRAKTVSLTHTGENMFLKFDERRGLMENSLLASLTDTEKQTFYDLLKKVYNGLKNV